MRQESFETYDGLRLPVRVVGSGPPLVIVPGWLGAPMDWHPVTQRLGESFSCYIWESRPWHTAEMVTVESMARDLRSLLKAYGLRHASVLGHSMGAMICWEYVRQFGCADINRFCLVDQTPRLITDDHWTLGLEGGYSAEENQVFIDWLRRDFTEAAMDLTGRGRYVEPGSGAARLEAMFRETRRRRIAAMEPEPWIRAWESFSWKDYRHEVGEMTVPTLLAYGAQSFYGLEVARYVHRRTPNSRLRIHALAGHSPHLDDLPDFVDNVREFATESFCSANGTC